VQEERSRVQKEMTDQRQARAQTERARQQGETRFYESLTTLTVSLIWTTLRRQAEACTREGAPTSTARE